MRRIWLLVSLGLNLGLLGLVFVLLFIAGPGAGRAGARSRVITNAVNRVVTRALEPEAEPPGPFAVRFHWRMVEAPDYQKYMANLRAIQCPEPTIQDIILADVNELFGQRLRTLVESAKGQFWSTMMLRNRPMDRATEKRVNDLLHERDVLLDDLLGANWESTRLADDDLDAAGAESGLLAFLPREKRAAVEGLRRQYPDGATDRSSPVWASLRQLLPVQELEEYRLRTSPGAALARDLRGLSLEPAAMRSLARIFAAGVDAPESEAGARQREDVRSLLGTAKFREFERALDPAYRVAYDVGVRYNLPADAALRAYEVQKTADAQMIEMRRDATLTDADRAEAIAAIEGETTRTLTTLLGANAVRTYQKYNQ